MTAFFVQFAAFPPNRSLEAVSTPAIAKQRVALVAMPRSYWDPLRGPLYPPAAWTGGKSSVFFLLEKAGLKKWWV